jgi:hypothetical protein
MPDFIAQKIPLKSLYAVKLLPSLYENVLKFSKNNTHSI